MNEKILIVDDQQSNRNILQQQLTLKGYVVDTASNGKEGIERAQAGRPDLIILDFMMPGLGGVDVLKELRRRDNDAPVIMLTAYGTVDRAVETMKEGAYDFITRPVDPDRMALVVKNALERQRLKRKVENLSEEAGQRYQLIIGESPKMKEVVEVAHKAAEGRSTVLLLGESGTGKEIFARNIHNWSARKNEPFVAINCVGMSKDLLESELFGHEQGAFTGALKQKRGKLEIANGGTVFFDEIGDISQDLQAKLLRFLQEREFERVGAVTPISVNVRVIAATNRNLERALKHGTFREDLYHRLNVIRIRLPALRERKEDIPALARHFWQRITAETGQSAAPLTDSSIETLMAHSWPGNVRELANVIERSVVLGASSTITPDESTRRVDAIQTFQSLSYRDGVNHARRELLLRALAQTQGNRTAAAKLLGLEGKYFLKLIKSLHIE
ncbi:MAG TPA: sigma-54 dependent transcriptional regulator [Candidatus Udaeobacter sp.]|jgi:DNA-binding NtrC family response regulator|nr:sigma-54 dependent transcriptional regulator [Candidatus Udaeobacter sp.]